MQINQAFIERPLLFKGEMVRAILDNRKTETRRLRSLDTINQNPNDFELKELFLEKIKKDLVIVARFTKLSTGELINIPCPYGKTQDLFWVRETWREALSENHECYAYRANMTYRCGKSMPSNDYSTVGWKPSIHMRKAIARIWLECTDIRVERLQDITEEGAIAEGIFKMPGGRGNLDPSQYHSRESAKAVFQHLWMAINGANSWDLNPYVWVVGIKKVEK